MIELEILGPARLHGADGHSIRSVLSQPKRLALLSYLAIMGPGTFVRRDRLLALFWPDSDERRARSSLSESLSRLRSSLGEEAILRRGIDEVALNPDVVRCDVQRFQEAMAAGDCGRASALYRGPLLDGLLVDYGQDLDNWLESTRARLQRSAVDFIGRHADELYAAGDSEALACAERVLELAPLDGDAVSRVMRFTAETGHRVEALRVFERFADRLDTELGIEPAARVAELARAIREDSAAIPVSPRARTAEESSLGEPFVGEPVGVFPDRPEDTRPGVKPGAPGRWRGVFGLATVGAVASVLALPVLRGPHIAPPAAGESMRFTVGLDEEGWLQLGGRWDHRRPTRTSLALSQAGDFLAFAGRGPTRDGPSSIYLRSMATGRTEALAGTDGGSSPFFSPDGKEVGFFAGRSLKRASISGGPVVLVLQDADLVEGPLSDAPDFHALGATWGDDGTIVFGGAAGLYRVPAEGGTPELIEGARIPDSLVNAVTGSTSGDRPGFFQPHLLPGGARLLYHRLDSRDPADAEILGLDLATGRGVSILRDAADPRYVLSGHLLFVRRGTLMAVKFDPDKLVVTGEPVPLLDDVMQAFYTSNLHYETGASQLAVSSAGHVAYVTGGVTPEAREQVVRLTPDGRVEPFEGMEIGGYGYFRVSDDGRRIAYNRGPTLIPSIWIYNLVTGTHELFEKVASGPVWSPDGSEIAFMSYVDGHGYVRRSDGTGEPTSLGQARLRPAAWSLGGALALLESDDVHVWEPGLETWPLLDSEASESDPAFSPDGRWLAYVSDRSGREQVYVRPYPGPGPVTLVSSGGGLNPAWSRDGTGLYYLQLSSTAPRHLMRVEVQGTETFRAGPPEPYVRWPGGGRIPTRGYDLLPDGSVITQVRPVEDVRDEREGAVRSYEVLVNFLKRLGA